MLASAICAPGKIRLVEVPKPTLAQAPKKPDGHWDYHFAHSSEGILDNPDCSAFLKGLGKRLAAEGAAASALVPHPYPEGDAAFRFSAKLEGRALPLDANDGTTRITQTVPLGE